MFLHPDNTMTFCGIAFVIQIALVIIVKVLADNKFKREFAYRLLGAGWWFAVGAWDILIYTNYTDQPFSNIYLLVGIGFILMGGFQYNRGLDNYRDYKNMMRKGP